MWTGAAIKRRYGDARYGQLQLGHKSDGTRRVTSPPRLAWETLIGPIPDQMTVDHLCRVPLCCNPHHLELVTRQENTRRRDILTRFPAVNPPRPFPVFDGSQRPTCTRGHDITVVGWYTNGTGKRTCAECSRMRNRKPGARALVLGTATHCGRGHERTMENTYVNPRGVGECIPCRRLRVAAKKAAA